MPYTGIAQDSFFTQANCTIVYSLERSADKYFNDEITQLSAPISRMNIHFIDLNNWGKASPHIEISGRLRNQLREQYNLDKSLNQAVLVDKHGQMLNRYSGSVTLVNALIDCN
tara:strand:- start:428 stop:766 length:339 start_codon:yes stop_codon:yes gene_type:complete